MDSAYFDRITENQQAILLVESSQKNVLVPLGSLPHGSVPGHWFLVKLADEQLISIQFDEKKTREITEDIQGRLARLQGKKKSRFKRRS